MSENSDVFNSRDIFLFYTHYRLHAMSQPLKKEVQK